MRGIPGKGLMLPKIDRKSKDAKSKALAEIQGVAPMNTVRENMEKFNVDFRSNPIVRGLYLTLQETMNVEEGDVSSNLLF